MSIEDKVEIVTDGLTIFLDSISKSPIMLGFAILLVNVGGRFTLSDINKYDEKLLSSSLIKKLTIFCIAFLSTRDISYSVIIVFVYSILFHPCGLAYKIMRYTYQLVTPFNFFQTMYIENDINTENNSLQVKKKYRIRKLDIERI
jgi:hypothetical protein